MKLRKLTATFGCLDRATLTFGPGLTLIGAPNGSGKSTWCAFLRVMLYGLDTRQRDRKGAPADKNRYRPWNGKPMEGLLECEHQGAVILLRRTSAGGVPMGDFSAVYQATGLPVPGLTADNAGEVLTGLSREVFDRSVFLRQTALAVTQSQDLEKRITDLVSSGEEDVSWSEANDRLKAWLHRRRFHKSGRIPLLEAEAAQLRQTVAQTAALRQDLAQQQARAATLRRQADHWDKRLSAETDKFQTVSQQRYAQAAAELDAAQLPRTLEDVTAAVINTNFAGEAGLIPARDALAMEGSESPYANIIVVRAADKDSPKAKALVKAVQSPEVKAYIEKVLVPKGIMPAF